MPYKLLSSVARSKEVATPQEASRLLSTRNRAAESQRQNLETDEWGELLHEDKKERAVGQGHARQAEGRDGGGRQKEAA